VLTKDLIRFTVKSDVVNPSFISTGMSGVQNACERLLSLYSNGKGLPQKEIDQNSTAVINSLQSSKIAKGLNKILLDNCEFEKNDDCDYVSLRKDLFLKSAKIYFSPNKDSFDDIRQGFDDRFLEDIYGDHPDCERLISCEIKSVEELIDEYNISLIQGLLLNAENLTINVENGDKAAMRYFFRQIRFN